MAIDFKKLNEQYEELSKDIDELSLIVEGVIRKKYAIEQILDHYTLETEGDISNVDL